MAIPHTMEEDGNAGHGEDLDLQVVVPEDVQAVMNAAEEGDAQALSSALGVFVLQLNSWFSLGFLFWVEDPHSLLICFSLNTGS